MFDIKRRNNKLTSVNKKTNKIIAMKKLILSILAGAAVATSVNAQEVEEAVEAAPESAPLVLSGSVDTYYRTTLNTSDNTALPYDATSFAGGTGFNIGMFNLVASKEGEKSGFVADVVFGPRGAAAGTIEDASNLVNQLYGYYNISDQLTFTMGRFNTFLGYEVISPSVNFNYSTSYMFSYGPFTHTGAKLDYAVTDELSLMVAALDNVDYEGTKAQNNLMFGAQIGYEVENGGVWLNYLGGNEGTDGSTTTNYNQFDITTGFNFTDELYLGLNATIARAGNGTAPSSVGDTVQTKNGFAGIAGYAQYAISDNFSIGGRAEYFTSKNGRVNLPSKTLADNDLNTTGSVLDLTLSANIKFGDLTVIPEVRADFFNNATTDANSTTLKPTDGTLSTITNKNGDLVNSVGAVSIAAVYTF